MSVNMVVPLMLQHKYTYIYTIGQIKQYKIFIIYGHRTVTYTVATKPTY